MKKFLPLTFVLLAFVTMSYGQATYLDFETIKDPLVEPFDLGSYESAVANPAGDGFVAKVVKGGQFWGGINIYFGGDVTFTGAGDTLMIDFYTAAAGVNDSIMFTVEMFNRYGGVDTYAGNAYYKDANDTQGSVWKTLKFALPDTLSGSYNQIVIFFGWQNVVEGDEIYFDNIVGPTLATYGDTDVTFNITDKFNNATDVKLFIDGADTPLTQSENVYTNTSALPAYTILGGQSAGMYEIVYSHMANGEEVRDTVSLLSGSADGTQELLQLIIVEAPEDGTALAISVGDTPPVIDGTIDAVWDNAKTHTMQERGWWGSPTGLYASFKLMYDLDNIYMLYVVEDATPYNGNTTSVWQNDGIETFFDMNQSASEGYDSDDWQIRTIRGLDTWTGSANVTDTWAANNQRAQSSMADDAGYIIELAIPWLSLSPTFLPIVGTPFNFDVSSTDVGTGGGARLFREAWTTAQDVAYMNTTFFGTVTISELTNETGGGTGIGNNEVSYNITVYPNPAAEYVSIRSEVEISSVQIMDITGRTVHSSSSINGFNTTLNVSNLIDGVYMISISDVNGGTAVQKLRVH